MVPCTVSDTYFEFSDFAPELVPDDLDDHHDDEDIDNVALANGTVSVPDDCTLTVQLFLIMLSKP